MLKKYNLEPNIVLKFGEYLYAIIIFINGLIKLFKLYFK